MNDNNTYQDKIWDAQKEKPLKSEKDLINSIIGDIKPQKMYKRIIKLLLNLMGILICGVCFLIPLKTHKSEFITKEIQPIMEIMLYAGLLLILSMMFCIYKIDKHDKRIYKNLDLK